MEKGLGQDTVSAALSQYYKDTKDVHIMYGATGLVNGVAKAINNSPSLKYVGFSFPINGHHQIAVMIDVKNNQIHFKDSLKSGIDRLETFVRDLNSSLGGQYVLKPTDQQPYGGQKHSWECGIYTFYNLIHMIARACEPDKPLEMADLGDLEARYREITTLSRSFEADLVISMRKLRQNKAEKMLLRDALEGSNHEQAKLLYEALKVELAGDNDEEIKNRAIGDFLREKGANGQLIVKAYMEFLKGDNLLVKDSEGIISASDDNYNLVKNFLNDKVLKQNASEVKVEQKPIDNERNPYITAALKCISCGSVFLSLYALRASTAFPKAAAVLLGSIAVVTGALAYRFTIRPNVSEDKKIEML